MALRIQLQILPQCAGGTAKLSTEVRIQRLIQKGKKTMNQSTLSAVWQSAEYANRVQALVAEGLTEDEAQDVADAEFSN